MAMSSESRARTLTAVNITALVLAVTVTALRCFVRIYLLKAFGNDDWLMAAATICFAFYCSFSLSGVAYGTGHLVSEISQENYAEAKKWWYLCYPFYAVTMMLVKMSMTSFFRRVIVERLHKWILYSAMVATIISCVVFVFTCIFQCWPVSYFWDKYTQTGTCIPDRIVIALAILFSVINMITDFTFALLPAWIVLRLNMKLRTKLALCALMGLGCVASAAIVVRMPYLQAIASDEFLYDTVFVAVWSTVEQCLAITAAGLATLQPLVKLIGYKLGLTSRPTVVGAGGVASGQHIPMTSGSIAVKRSFARRTEQRTSAHNDLGLAAADPSGLKLQPVVGEYTAECYNTSQEFLRLPSSEGSDLSQSMGVDKSRR
ncbi:uncharacterized protein P884DRAFT_280763 [Thermothelomyces heterothallicus CBS 202.75]|uniref:uncharacterized protein n=1 Tax=Thermothelomyces heterothallicus CBS 202.75 TaxID=1149848 RepID=UPI003741F395